jgi:hypothetical protein
VRRSRAKRANGTAADAFYGGSVVRVERKGGRGVRGSAPHGGGKGEERGGPDHDGGGGGAWRPPSALDWRAVGLRRDRGGQRGMGDPSRARLTDGAGRRRGPVGSGGVREGVRGSEAVVASGC